MVVGQCEKCLSQNMLCPFLGAGEDRKKAGASWQCQLDTTKKPTTFAPRPLPMGQTSGWWLMLKGRPLKKKEGQGHLGLVVDFKGTPLQEKREGQTDPSKPKKGRTHLGVADTRTIGAVLFSWDLQEKREGQPPGPKLSPAAHPVRGAASSRKVPTSSAVWPVRSSCDGA